MIFRYLIFLAALGLLSGCATNPATGNSDFVLMSEKDEIELGKQGHQEVLREYSVYNDLELQNYVQYVGKKVAANSHRPNLEYTFTVLDSPEVNAFALPGGYIYITRGLMAYLNTEAELAAVLGHEIGHVTARHAARQHSATQMAGLGAAIGTILGEAIVPGISSAGGQDLIGIFGTAMLRGYGRDHELEADRLGAEYLARSGYDPDAMLEVIGVLKNQELFEIRLAREENRQPRIYHGVFSTHPDNDTRLQEVVGYAHNIKEASTGTFVGRTEYLQRVDGMVYGESRSDGMIRERDFYHGPLGISIRFPDRWAIRNLPDRLQAVPANQLAMMQVFAQPANPSLTPKDFMAQYMKIDTRRAGEEIQINGQPAYITTAVLDTNEGQRLARVAVIYHQNMAYIFAGHTRDNNGLARYDQDFQNTIRSFRPLSNAERAVAVRSQRIRLVRADESTRFDALAKSSGLDKFPEQQLRLINSKYPDGQLEPDQLLKVIETR